MVVQAGGSPASVLATKHAETMAQKNIIEPSCGTAVHLPQTNAAQSEQSTQYAASLSHSTLARRTDLGGLACGLHSIDAALKVPSTSLSISSATPVRAGACIMRVVTLPRLPVACIVASGATASLPETTLDIPPFRSVKSLLCNNYRLLLRHLVGTLLLV